MKNECICKILSKSLVKRLTSEEIEVLKLISKIKTNLEISIELNISRAEAKLHFHNILTKFELNDRREVALVGIHSEL